MLKRLRPGNGETIEVKVKGLELPILLRRSARARRFSLQVSEARRGAILTMPVYSSFADADEFLSRHLDWLKERVAGLSEPVPFTHGAIVPLRGFAHHAPLRRLGPAARRGVDRSGGRHQGRPAWPQGARLPIRRLPRLVVAGETEHAPRRLLDWLKRQAHRDLQRARRRARQPARPHAEPHRRARSDHALGLVLHRRARCPSPGGSFSRRPSCSIISPRTRSPISPR